MPKTRRKTDAPTKAEAPAPVAPRFKIGEQVIYDGDDSVVYLVAELPAAQGMPYRIKRGNEGYKALEDMLSPASVPVSAQQKADEEKTWRATVVSWNQKGFGFVRLYNVKTFAVDLYVVRRTGKSDFTWQKVEPLADGLFTATPYFVSVSTEYAGCGCESFRRSRKCKHSDASQALLDHKAI